MKCELICADCHPKAYCSFKSLNAFDAVGSKTAIKMEALRMPSAKAHTVIDARKRGRIHGSPSNLGGGTPPQIEHIHEPLGEFIPDTLNSSQDLAEAKIEAERH